MPDGFVAQQLLNIPLYTVMLVLHNVVRKRRWPKPLTYLAPIGAALPLAVLTQWLAGA